MKDILIGMAVGDALGVPYEFKSREAMEKFPATGMVGYGTHNQPKGTWSDDSSMAFCLTESLCKGLNYDNIAMNFSNWFYHAWWTPHGVVFDHGFATAKALDNYNNGITPVTSCGGKGPKSNGNGSVMRTLALVPFIENMSLEERYKIVSDVSSITHAHWISKFSCFLVCEFAINLRKGVKKIAWSEAVKSLEALAFNTPTVLQSDFEEYFGKYLVDDITETLTDDDFQGSGFARDTAVTSAWCILTTSDYAEATLKAVNFGDDTDTTACVVGGLAGTLYGIEDIPSDWLERLVKRYKIENLAERYEESRK